jgi:hypothetical protein
LLAEPLLPVDHHLQLYRSQLHLSIDGKTEEAQTSKEYAISGEISPDLGLSVSQNLGRHAEWWECLLCFSSYPAGFSAEPS